MQALELKRGLPANNLRGALRTFLETKFHRNPEDFKDDLDELEALRGQAIAVTLVPESAKVLIR